MPSELADPPAVEREPELARRLAEAYRAKGPDYAPRTHLTQPDGRAKYVNRLIEEPSPYLVQHAHNPVDWHPWSRETLAKAARLDRPIFLSVGYATCHWCHVMEEESFDDEEVARVLNADFIPVKIDREQRPDLDHVYITATQLQQGHAGWPNSAFLMPDGRPFHTGTYFPKPQFLHVLGVVAEAWKGPRRDEIERVAGQLAQAIASLGPGPEPAAPPPGEAARQALLDQLAKMHNADQGGFSTSQQFPQEGFLLFLLDHWRRTGSDAALGMAERTLEAIAAGGIHDHAGGGFHRYTVDPNWRTPHFEKMLYNQALLARAFLEGWQITGRPAWQRAVRRAFDYVARDMTDAEGAFFAAEDADSLDEAGRREEGAFYAWTPGQVRAALGPDADEAVRLLGLDKAATIEAGAVAHLEPGGEPDFARLDPMLERLRRAREARPRPIRDEKVIAGWNGLMIRALAEGADALDEPAYADMAARAAETLWRRLWTGERLHRLWAEGRALEDGTLEDYAWAGLGCLALMDATGEPRWRERAETLATRALEIFGHPSGRLRMAAADGPTGPIFDSADGAVPSGESSMLELLARLDPRSADPAFRAAADRLLGAIGGALSQMPLLRPDAMVAAAVLADGESGYGRSLGKGVVRVRLAPGGRSLRLAIAEGWHLNAHDPGPDWLIGAAIKGARADWPPGEEVRLGFAEQPVRVYHGTLALTLAPEAPVVSLSLQPCSETACLAPERATFRLW